ncbi:uncharacterized protein LOC131182962 [Hevea brasiliensis]|uniref:uncharacterized protein LOC131182962 n=1 Tax=Hevea brasiliensis TaxID=3981 RepID=UPI0025E8636B|nr:uncharacterized protein LOC131182962 [Hevea brasiliensis]
MLGEWRITGFYGRPNRNERRASWALLRELASQYSYPWVCCGDFNAILTQDEKRGGNFYPTYLVQDFRDAVLQAGLSDVNMNGYKYTWDNARDDDDWVEAKLDRFLANDDWKRRFILVVVAKLLRKSGLILPGSVLEKLQFCSVRLGEWGDNLRKLYKQEIDDCKRVMSLLRGKRDAHSRESFRMAKSKFLDLLRRKESYWRQRAKEFWLKEGDQNTKFFHRKNTIRQRKNRIDRLKDDNGNWCDWSTGLEAMITDYFKNIFTSNADEVREAVFSMQADKSPGLDGFNPGFYQKYWTIIGDQVSNFCISCIRDREFPSELNDTAIVLIPKKEHVERMSDLRPIALCKVLYKIISKMIANRLKKYPEKCRVAYETLHYMRGKRRGRDGYAALKIDVSKAFDRLEWKFLTAMLMKLGFDTNFVEFLYLCVSSVSFKVLHQGMLTDAILPGRGLRQGDPLSPYLFILCMEGLSRLIHNRVAIGRLNGVAVEGPRANVHDETRQNICNILQVCEQDNLGSYLGLPTAIGRNKQEVFQFVKDKFWRRINSWKNKALSRAGKEILVKTVLQSLPNYVMNLFLLPKGICDDLQQIMARFWWGTKVDGSRSLHWLGWDRLACHKHFGGLSFKKIRQFNIAMLGRMGWHLYMNSNSLASRILKAKYYPNVSFLEAPIGNNPSYVWRSIRESQSLIRDGLLWRVGDGNDIAIWLDSWLPDVAFPMVTTTFDFNFRVYMVSNLITEGAWNIDLVNRVFNERDRKLILSIPLRRSSSIDLQFWKHDKRGAYSIAIRFSIDQIKTLFSHVPTTQVCPLCNVDCESVKHVLVECSFARHVWLASHLGWFSPSTHSFQDWLMRALALFNPNDSATLAYLCWSIWEERNSVVWKSAQPAANSCRLRGLRLKREWDDALVSIRAAIPPTADLPTPQEWKKPGPNWVKLNVDIATNVNSGWTGIGMVVRNEMGSFVACKISRMVGLFSPTIAEIMGVREALSWIKDNNWQNVIVESDNLQVVNVLNSMNVENFSMMGGIVSDCRSLINEISCEILFSHVFRSANGVAHALAQATRSFPNAMEWTLSPPEFVSLLLL